MKIRDLNTEDFMKVADMIKKSLPAFGRIEFSQRKEEDKKEYTMRTGMEILNVFFEYCYDDIWPLLASLAGMTLEEFKVAPINTIPDVIEALMEKPELPDFFAKLRELIGSRLSTYLPKDTDGASNK